MTVYGIHTNAQNKSIDDLISIWRHADQLGYGWISISDHFPGSLGPMSNEAVVSHATMAANTARARCSVLCYSAGFRHPIVLASAVTLIDELSGGRAAIGLGAGSVARDYEIYGFPHPPLGERMDVLEEAVQCVAGLLHDEAVDFTGKHFRISGASQQPRPVQDRLPVWVGTTGERRGLRIAAAHADGWNAAFVSPDAFAHKRDVLHQHCQDVGRDPAELRCSVNLMLMLGTEPGSLPEERRASVLAGSIEQVIERLDEYVDAGADQINLALGHPWDFDGVADLAGALSLPAA